MDLVSDKIKTITYNVNNEKLDVHPIGVVDDSIIIKVWEELRKELKEKGYSTDGKIMSEVVALLISSDEFDVFFKRCRNLPNSIYKEEQEYGTRFSHPIASALSLPVVNNSFHILICKDRCPLNEDLRHELLHPWEKVLGLSWGTLTRIQMFGN